MLHWTGHSMGYRTELGHTMHGEVAPPDNPLLLHGENIVHVGGGRGGGRVRSRRSVVEQIYSIIIKM
jgi:hypothetical protein